MHDRSDAGSRYPYFSAIAREFLPSPRSAAWNGSCPCRSHGQERGPADAGSYVADRAGSGSYGSFAAHGVLPNPGGPAGDDPHTVRVATGGFSIAGIAEARGRAENAVQRPKRWRLRYRPFREIPSALAVTSTRPWCFCKAAPTN